MKNKNLKKILFGVVFCVGLGTLSIIVGIKNSKLRGENEILKQNLSDLNKRCDDKDRYIGRILTELKNK